jgi:hypothetical protein
MDYGPLSVSIHGFNGPVNRDTRNPHREHCTALKRWSQGNARAVVPEKCVEGENAKYKEFTGSARCG